MTRPDLFKELLERAFRLAYFTCADREAALRVAASAMLKLEVASQAQAKRLYYMPARRSDVTRTKVILSDKHLLQRLVYIELEKFEREIEEARAMLKEETMVVHFIKHLVRITMRRNSFYVALGISRLLHDYTTAEAMEIYNVVVQDPDRVKDDYYYRSRKALLMDEMKKRFGDLVELTRGPRGEERFKCNGSSQAYAELVEECLQTFTPWDTPCLIPCRFDPTGEEIPQLAHDARNGRDAVETNRMHALIEPNCYRHIADALRLEKPLGKLNIPHFILPKGGDNVNGPRDDDRRLASNLTEAELEALAENLASQSARRKTSHAGLLTIAVDGRARAKIDLNRASSTKLALNDDDELIEVRDQSSGDDLLLATYVINHAEVEDDARANNSEIVLEGGQRIIFALSTAGSEDYATIEINYRETKLTRAAALFLRRTAFKLSLATKHDGVQTLPAFRMALMMAFIIALAGVGVWLALRTQPEQLNQPLSAQEVRSEKQAQPSPSIKLPQIQEPASPQLNQNTRPLTEGKERAASTPGEVQKSRRNLTTQTTGKNSSPSEQAALRHPRRTANEPSSVASSSNQLSNGSDDIEASNRSAADSRSTRSLSSNNAVTKLSAVRRIFVEGLSADPQLKQLEAMLRESIGAASRLVSTTQKDDADAVLKLSLPANDNQTPAKASPRTSRREIVVVIKLVNEDGAVIWPTNKRRAGIYTGTLDNISQAVVRDLLKRMQVADARQ